MGATLQGWAGIAMHPLLLAVANDDDASVIMMNGISVVKNNCLEMQKEVQYSVDRSFPFGHRCMFLLLLKYFHDTEKSNGRREWLPEICTNMTGGVDTQPVNAILLSKGSNLIVIHVDDGVVFSVDILQGNRLVPRPALLLAEIVGPFDCTE